MKYEKFLLIKKLKELTTPRQKLTKTEAYVISQIEYEFQQMVLDLKADLEQKNFNEHGNIETWLKNVTFIYKDNILSEFCLFIENIEKRTKKSLVIEKSLPTQVETKSLRSKTKQEILFKKFCDEN